MSTSGTNNLINGINSSRKRIDELTLELTNLNTSHERRILINAEIIKLNNHIQECSIAYNIIINGQTKVMDILFR